VPGTVRGAHVKTLKEKGDSKKTTDRKRGDRPTEEGKKDMDLGEIEQRKREACEMSQKKRWGRGGWEKVGGVVGFK